MARILAAVVLGASLILTTAAAFAESNSAKDRESAGPLARPLRCWVIARAARPG